MSSRTRRSPIRRYNTNGSLILELNNQYGTFLPPVSLNYSLRPTNAAPNRRYAILPIHVVNNKLPKNNRRLDPIGLRKFKKGNYAIRVNNKNGITRYFKPKSFNRWFGKHWRTLNEKSNEVISNKKHPFTRRYIKRSQIKVVQFTS